MSAEQTELLEKLKSLGQVLPIAAAIAGIACLSTGTVSVVGVITAGIALVAIALLWRFRGLYDVEEYRNTVRSRLVLTLAIVGGVLGTVGLLDADVRLTPLLPAALLLGAAVGVPTARQDPLLAPAGVAAISLAAAGVFLALLAQADVMLDSSPPQINETVVAYKRSRAVLKSSRRYYIAVSPWGGRRGVTEFWVNGTLYDSVNKGEPICVTSHAGALRAGWLAVDKCQ